MTSISVLLSIKPKYVEKILEGEKTVDFRKRIWKEDDSNIEKVYIYSSSPVNQIVGYFEPVATYIGFPDNLWDSFADESGMSEEEFFEYFNIPAKHGYAIVIDNLVVFDEPINTSTIDGFTAPQSFSYIKNDYLKEIRPGTIKLDLVQSCSLKYDLVQTSPLKFIKDEGK